MFSRPTYCYIVGVLVATNNKSDQTYNIFYLIWFCISEYDGYDDVYGHSVEEDSCISPSDGKYVIISKILV